MRQAATRIARHADNTDVPQLRFYGRHDVALAAARRTVRERARFPIAGGAGLAL